MKKASGKTALRHEFLCRGFGATWIHSTGTTRTSCPFCGKGKDARKRKYDPAKRPTDWGKINGDKRKQYQATSRAIKRRQLLFRVAGTNEFKCVRCGCDDARLLEVNHKFGGGSKETQKGKRMRAFHKEIEDGRRKTDDLELLCKPCNAIHALELRFGSLPMKTVWNG